MGTPSKIIHSCDSLRKENITCPKVTVIPVEPIVHSTYGWSVSNVPRSVPLMTADPVQRSAVNFTTTVNKKLLSTRYIVCGDIYIQNTESFDMLMPIHQGLTVTGSPKPTPQLNPLPPQLNLSAPLSVVTGLADNIISGIDSSLDNVLSGDAKSLLRDPNNGFLAVLKKGLPWNGFQDQRSTYHCDGHVTELGYVIRGFEVLLCRFELELGSRLRTLVTAAALLQIPNGPEFKVVSNSELVDFAVATSIAPSDSASLLLDINCKPHVCPKDSLTDIQGAPLVGKPMLLTDSFQAQYAVQVGGYCTAKDCDTTCRYEPPSSLQVHG
jgi:hypothetical protein